MSIAVSIILLLLAIFAYRGMPGAKGGRWLLILRLLVVGLFFFLLAGEVINIVWKESPGWVAILVDRTESMSAIKADSSVIELARIIGANLPKGLRARIWSFGDSVYPGITNGQFYQRTHLGKALKLVGKNMPAAIVLLTDGQDNGEDSPVNVVKNSGVPVYVVGFGGEIGFNLRITEVELPSSVYAGDTVPLRVRVLIAGLDSSKPVRVTAAGQSRVVVAGSGFSEQDVEFSLVFNQSGKRDVVVKVESLPGEMSYLDNSWHRVIEVKPARIGVVYITNRPGPGTRFILNILGRSSRVNLKPVVSLSGHLDINEWGDGEVFILDGVEEREEENIWWQKLRARVEAGAGLLVIAGPEFRPGEVLRPLIGLSGWSGEKGSWTPVKARDTGIFDLFEPELINLDELPPFTGMVSGTITDGARVWLEAQESGKPLIIDQRVKKGRVVYVAGYPLWRWGFMRDYPVDRQTPLEVFLERVIPYLAEKDTTLFLLQTDGVSYLRGEPVRLVLFARRPDGWFWEGLDVQVRLDTQSRYVPMVERGKGRYEARVSTIAPGAHYAIAEVRSEDKVLGRARVDWTVTEQGLELVQLGLNRNLLDRIAEAGNGWLVLAESLDLRRIPEIKTRSYERSLRINPRIMPWWFGLMAVLFGLELFLRRQKGLY